MEQEISWGDGTRDKFKISPKLSSGNQTIIVVSDANNTGKQRSKTVTYITTTSPYKRVTLTIVQDYEIIK